MDTWFRFSNHAALVIQPSPSTNTTNESSPAICTMDGITYIIDIYIYNFGYKRTAKKESAVRLQGRELGYKPVIICSGRLLCV